MKVRISPTILTALLSVAFAAELGAQGTTFSYQGSLSENNQPANGLYEFRFILYNAESGGSQMGGILTRAPVTVANGVFTTTLDFGAGVFDGTALWLGLAVRPSGSANPFDPLAPRQPVLPTPYAITAGNLTGNGAGLTALNANNLASGVVPDTRLSANVSLLGQTIESAEITDGTITAADLDTASFGTAFWRTTGNLGTDPSVNFLGTLDFQSLDIRANNIRALRLQPHVSGSANLIGGYSGNAVAPGRGGATIAGGGTPGQANQVQHDFGTVSGGKGNDAGGQADTIGGGDRNRIGLGGFDNTIAGGLLNDIGSNTTASAVGGGWDNNIAALSLHATIAGGFQNNIANNSSSSAIGGGRDNIIAANAPHATIAGGYLNDIGLNADSSAIGGGQNNNIGADALWATIGGGWFNDIFADADWSTIGGGRDNNIGSGSFYATIAGGADNDVGTNSVWGAIGGGKANRIADESRLATIAGGFNNDIGLYADGSVIGGGDNNNIADFSFSATIAGGHDNNVASNSPNATIAGGRENFIGVDSGDATIAGGYANGIGPGALFSTIGGGQRNHIFSATNAVIAGGYLNDIAPRSSFSAIVGGEENNILSDSPRTTIAGGFRNMIGNTSDHSVIGGGYDNDIGANSPDATIAGGHDNNVASNSPEATIAGGFHNRIGNNSSCSTIGGGNGNEIPDETHCAVIPGGAGNVAAGDYSFAAGVNAKAEHIGAFVWSDGSGTFVTSSDDYSVTFRAIGGYRFFTGSLHDGGAELAAGATSWSVMSDRNLKKDIRPVDCQSILDKLSRVPVTQWHYEWEAESEPMNLGPMAQDFKAAFYPGRDDKSITTLEFDGVALAAIQGLNQKLTDELKHRDAENAELKQRLEKLEQLLNQQMNGGER